MADVWAGVKKALGAGAPLIANAILPGSGGFAAALVAKALGVESTPAAIEAGLLSATPEQWADIKSEEHRHSEELSRIAADLDKAYLADRQNARSRDTSLRQAGYHNYRADAMLALAFASLVTIIFLINGNAAIKPEVLAIFNMAVGALLKMISDGFQFEFGSSRGSKEKDAR